VQNFLGIKWSQSGAVSYSLVGSWLSHLFFAILIPSRQVCLGICFHAHWEQSLGGLILLRKTPKRSSGGLPSSVRLFSPVAASSAVITVGGSGFEPGSC
jgi:hypothetical protein